MEWTREQRAVRALLLKRHVQGMSLAIARALRIGRHTVSLFKTGKRAFSRERLASLREYLLRQRPSPPARVRKRRRRFSGPRAEWTEEQKAVRTLLVKRHIHGMGREIARELGVADDTVYFFKSGEKPFPKEKLGSLQQILVSWPSPSPRPVPKRRTPPPGKAEQQAVRRLLAERYVHGMGREIARELSVASFAIYAFRRGRQALSMERLALMREFLLRERSDPQAPIRELLRQCLSRRVVSASDVARRFRLHRSTISRFKNGSLPFPPEQLEELAAYLRTRLARSAGEPGVALQSVRELLPPARMAARPPGERATRRARGALGSPMRVVLVELATRYAKALIEAVRLEPLRELPGPRREERG